MNLQQRQGSLPATASAMLVWQIGDVRIDRIVEFQQPLLAAAALYPAATPDAIARHRDWLEPMLMEPGTGLMTIAFHSFLIHSGKYLFVQEEWNYWRDTYRQEVFAEDPYYTDTLLPVIEAGCVEFVAMDHVFDAAVRLLPLPGHTPGHVGVHVESRGEACVMTGDLMHTALQVAEPDWSSCFCVDPTASAAMRRAFFERYADSGVLVLPAHFPTPTAGWVVREGDHFKFRFDAGGVR
jgi:hypothetical protein